MGRLLQMRMPREPLLPATTSRIDSSKEMNGSLVRALIAIIFLGVLYLCWAKGNENFESSISTVKEEQVVLTAIDKQEAPTMLQGKEDVQSTFVYTAEDIVDQDVDKSVVSRHARPSGPTLRMTWGDQEQPDSPVLDEPAGLYSMNATSIEGNTVQMSQYSGMVSIVVNVASHCGYTDSNYSGLQALYEEYKSQGFTVLAFPCNQFGGQEPLSNAEIREFASNTYNATFPIFSKVDVNGPSSDPIYTFLKQNLPKDAQPDNTTDIKLRWNFQKFLVDRSGYPQKLFYEKFDRDSIKQAIEPLLDTSQGMAIT